MYPAQQNAIEEARKLGLPLDEALIFQVVPTEILRLVVAGAIDPVAMAREEIASRGLSQGGKWVGFEKAAAELEQER